MTPTCPYCGEPAELVTGKAIYPHRPELHRKRLWRCEPCDAHVGCHEPARGRRGFGDGTVPLGRLANAELRRAKQDAHDAFDPMWEKGRMARGAAYAWLAERMGMDERQCHITNMSVEQCRRVVAIMKERSDANARGDA